MIGPMRRVLVPTGVFALLVFVGYLLLSSSSVAGSLVKALVVAARLRRRPPLDGQAPGARLRARVDRPWTRRNTGCHERPGDRRLPRRPRRAATLHARGATPFDPRGRAGRRAVHLLRHAGVQGRREGRGRVRGVQEAPQLPASQRRRARPTSGTPWPATTAPRARSTSPSTSPCRTTWSAGSSRRRCAGSDCPSRAAPPERGRGRTGSATRDRRRRGRRGSAYRRADGRRRRRGSPGRRRRCRSRGGRRRAGRRG